MKKAFFTFFFMCLSCTLMASNNFSEREMNSNSICSSAEFKEGYEVVYDWYLYYCTATIYYYGQPVSTGSGVGTTAAAACEQAEANAWRNMQ